MLTKQLLLSKIVSICAIYFMQTSMAISQSDLTDFSTSTGICKITEKKELQDQKKSEGSLFLEYSYTLEETKIFEARGFSRETNTVIPPLTHVFCLAKARDKMLITAAKDTEKYCGWVDNDALLEAGDGGNILSGSSLAPCGQIKPMKLGQFCEKSEDLSSEQDGCRLEAVKASVINTKFVTDNTTAISSDGNSATKSVDIPVYSRPESDQILQTVKIFSIFEVFDVGLNPKNNELMLLVGMNANDLKGWININSGKIWYSNLSTFFSRDGEGDIKRFPIGEPSNETIAKRPDRNSISFVSQSDHFKYPVLFDFRKSDSSTPKSIRPHLKIAFRGKLWEEGDISSLEPGFAVLTEAARDLYSLGTEGVSDTIVTTGYIESVKFGQDDPNWDYFVALTRSEMDKLTKNMETVCYTLGSSGDDSNVVISSVSQMIETLSGDRIGPDNLGAYFRDRTSIPLISQTILGDRIFGLVEAIRTGKDLTEYKKSFCKTSVLTTLILENKRLPKPVPGGSLTWNGDDFDTTDEQDFDWVYTDEFKRDTVFLPLAYLP